MPAEKKVYENQQLTLQLNTYIDLSPEVGNTAYLVFSPGNPVPVQIPVNILGDPTQGILTYTFPVNTLVAGDYRVQSYLILQQMPGLTFTFHVYSRGY